MRKGFTLIEMIFVIVIFGILSKFGAELLFKIYENYIYSNTSNRLLNQSEIAVTQIANRLHNRIKDSTIARDSIGATAEPIGSNSGDESVLEWVGVDVDGWRGTGAPEWSGFIDLEASTNTVLSSPGTQAGLSSNAALFFIGSNVNVGGSSFGWDGNASTTAMHKITSSTANHINVPLLTNVDVYEYYQLATSAYSIVSEATTCPNSSLVTNNLWLYYDYQPWTTSTTSQTASDAATANTKSLIMKNVDSFSFTSMGDIMVIQVCVSDCNVTGLGEYTFCKEKVVF